MKNSKSYGLKLGLLNVRSLNTGRDELLASIDRYKPDILALNETWLKQYEQNYALVVPGYVLKHKARAGDARGGGVGFYVRKELRARIKLSPDSPLEQLWLELIIPDFNVDMLQPEKPSCREVTEFLNYRNLAQIVQEPTRVNEKNSSLLDLVITDSPEICNCIHVYHNPDLSDHAMIITNLNVKKTKRAPKFIWKRFLDGINDDNFSKDLQNMKRFKFTENTNVNERVKCLNEAILLIFNKHAPLKGMKICEMAMPWITDNIKFMMLLRDKALNRAHTAKKVKNIQKERTRKDYYRSLKNLVNGALDREKSAYYTYYVNKNINKPKQMWSYFKQSCPLGNSNHLSTLPLSVNNPNAINDFFLNVPGNENVDHSLIQLFKEQRHSSNIFEIKQVTEEDILKTISSISTNAFGHDDINIQMVKLTLPVTLPIITQIINQSISTNTFPDSWKLAKVKPIPKGGKVEDYKDLRPISILPVLSKIAERVVCTQLTKFLENGKMLPEIQSGFRTGYSTATALAKLRGFSDDEDNGAG
ncbi:jg6192 [Pararge aegeria aegeria]|uniref:Jg6192 protein n=1 Tax=Pararge aegeria aegeria TaxID=348720 RepID=A0A8S4S4M2_9NEOP|nr:jg6192 [Pararge aegeria aegeria]